MGALKRAVTKLRLRQGSGLKAASKRAVTKLRLRQGSGLKAASSLECEP
jgi:hypothetical protein